MDSPSIGSLRITTLRKLPIMAPKIIALAGRAISSIMIWLSYLFNVYTGYLVFYYLVVIGTNMVLGASIKAASSGRRPESFRRILYIFFFRPAFFVLPLRKNNPM